MMRRCEMKTALAPAQGNPRQQKRAERTVPEEGLKHKVSEAKALRESAKLLDKQIERQQQLFYAGPKLKIGAS